MIKDGYWKCPCAACQRVMSERDGPRPPCERGNQFEAETGEVVVSGGADMEE